MLPLIKYYSVHFNHVKMIDWQIDSLYKHSKNPFQLLIINNASDDNLRAEINRKCNDLQLEVIQTSNDTPFALAGRHHQIALNDVWQNHCIKDQCVVGIMDGDVFPLRQFKIEAGDWTIQGGPQHRKEFEYISPVIMFFNMYNLPAPEEIDFIGEEVEKDVHLDTAGNLVKYFQKYPFVKEKVKLMKQTHHIKASNNNLHVLPKQVLNTYKNEFEVEIFNEIFLHYCRSSGWAPADKPFVQQKEEWVKDFIYKCISGDVKISQTGFDVKDAYLGWSCN